MKFVIKKNLCLNFGSRKKQYLASFARTNSLKRRQVWACRDKFRSGLLESRKWRFWKVSKGYNWKIFITFIIIGY